MKLKQFLCLIFAHYQSKLIIIIPCLAYSKDCLSQNDLTSTQNKHFVIFSNQQYQINLNSLNPMQTQEPKLTGTTEMVKIMPEMPLKKQNTIVYEDNKVADKSFSESRQNSTGSVSKEVRFEYNGKTGKNSQQSIMMLHVKPQEHINLTLENLSLYEHSNSALEETVRQLEARLAKKNQLVKYLERKCGEKKLISERKYEETIESLKNQNAKLKKSVQQMKRLLRQNIQNGSLVERYQDQLKKYDSRQKLSLACSLNLLNIPNQQISGEQKDIFDQTLLQNLTRQQLKQIIHDQNLQIHQLRQCTVKKLYKTIQKQSSKKRLTACASAASYPVSNQNINISNLLPLPLPLQLKPRTTNTHSQTPAPQFYDFDCQTLLTSANILNYETLLNDLSVQIQQLITENSLLVDQNSQLIHQNKNLKQQAYNLQQKTKQAFDDIHLDEDLLNNQIQFSIGFDNSDRKQQPNANNSKYKEHYNQILQIFGLHEHEDQSIESTHRRLLQQIYNTKMQISGILKQYKKLQKQYIETHTRKCTLEQYMKYAEERIPMLQGQIEEQTVLNQALNQMIMGLQVRVMDLRQGQRDEQCFELGLEHGEGDMRVLGSSKFRRMEGVSLEIGEEEEETGVGEVEKEGEQGEEGEEGEGELGEEREEVEVEETGQSLKVVECKLGQQLSESSEKVNTTGEGSMQSVEVQGRKVLGKPASIEQEILIVGDE